MGQNDLRYRLNVPPEDESVLQWLKEQKHPSISLRLLIKEDIQRNGFVDQQCEFCICAGRSLCLHEWCMGWKGCNSHIGRTSIE